VVQKLSLSLITAVYTEHRAGHDGLAGIGSPPIFHSIYSINDLI
jgi:hypothetical protein